MRKAVLAVLLALVATLGFTASAHAWTYDPWNFQWDANDYNNGVWSDFGNSVAPITLGYDQCVNVYDNTATWYFKRDNGSGNYTIIVGGNYLLTSAKVDKLSRKWNIINYAPGGGIKVTRYWAYLGALGTWKGIKVTGLTGTAGGLITICGGQV